MVADSTLGLGMWHCFVRASCSHIRSRNSVQALLKTHEEADLDILYSGHESVGKKFLQSTEKQSL